ncbi:hypothetical protein AB0N09_28020 [Streptomyces erythrochromogenes]|uniref:hypothetical protein n=1 Tax=Streptomyces erythrochromogenes TaxID=285574 RepID=UPI00342D6746
MRSETSPANIPANVDEQLAVIARAAAHLLETNVDELVSQLAGTSLTARQKSDPRHLGERLSWEDETRNPILRSGAYRVSRQVLKAAGLA